MPALFAPFRNRDFRNIWLAAIFSNIGTWMHEAGAGWYMVTLNASPLMVSAVQAVTFLPIFILSIPAGVLADIINRRFLLLISFYWLFITALLLSIATFLGWVTPVILLVMTFMLGVGTALMKPVFMAVVPHLVEEKNLLSAINLNSLSISLARTIGPALAGVVILMLGQGAVFLLNAVSFLLVIFAVIHWQPEKENLPKLKSSFLITMKQGWQYIFNDSATRRVIAQGAMFFFSASSLWALLPIFIQREWHLGADAYGLQLAVIGFGAVTGGVALPVLKKKFPHTSFFQSGMVLFLLANCIQAITYKFSVLTGAMLFTGMGWSWALVSLHSNLQSILPKRLRGRGLSIFTATNMGVMALGSMVWGVVASSFEVRTSLNVASLIGFVMLLIFISRTPLVDRS